MRRHRLSLSVSQLKEREEQLFSLLLRQKLSGFKRTNMTDAINKQPPRLAVFNHSQFETWPSALLGQRQGWKCVWPPLTPTKSNWTYFLPSLADQVRTIRPSISTSASFWAQAHEGLLEPLPARQRHPEWVGSSSQGPHNLHFHYSVSQIKVSTIFKRVQLWFAGVLNGFNWIV